MKKLTKKEEALIEKIRYEIAVLKREISCCKPYIDGFKERIDTQIWYASMKKHSIKEQTKLVATIDVMTTSYTVERDKKDEMIKRYFIHQKLAKKFLSCLKWFKGLVEENEQKIKENEQKIKEICLASLKRNCDFTPTTYEISPREMKPPISFIISIDKKPKCLLYKDEENIRENLYHRFKLEVESRLFDKDTLRLAQNSGLCV